MQLGLGSLTPRSSPQSIQNAPLPSLPPVSSIHPGLPSVPPLPPPPPPSHHVYQEHAQPPIHSQQHPPPPHHHLQPKHQPSYPPPLQPYYTAPPPAPPHIAPYAHPHHPGLVPLAASPLTAAGPSSIPLKRSAAHLGGIHGGAAEPPPKKMGKWTPEEDRLAIELRRKGMKWEDISKQLPGRSAISCRLRYQNYSEKRPEWDEERKNKLARLYNRFKKEMWDIIAKEMSLPWRAVEAMHWQMGAEEMAQRANVTLFQTHVSSSTAGTSARNITSSTSGRNKRKASSKSPALTGGASDSSVGAPLHDPPTGQSSSSGAPLTRPRRSSSAAHRRRNDSKVGERARDSYGILAEDQQSPGGVLLGEEKEKEREHVRIEQETPGSNGGDSILSTREWREGEHDEGTASEQPRSRSLSSMQSGGSVNPPSLSEVKHEL